MATLTPRAAFIAEASKNPKKLAAYAWDAMRLASTHDPDHSKMLKALFDGALKEEKLQETRFSGLCERLVKLETTVPKLELDVKNLTICVEAADEIIEELGEDVEQLENRQEMLFD